MIHRLFVILPLVLGCTPSGGDAGIASEAVHRGEGWAVRVPEGARVQAAPDQLQVDAPDGRWWFDVRWARGPGGQPALLTWSAEHCDVVQWDRPAVPVDGTTVGTGQCTRDGRAMWIMTSAEEHGDHVLLTTFFGDRRYIALEDAWVAFTRTALSLGPGDAPVSTPPGDEVRRSLRGLVNGGALGDRPVPGGGELSPRMAEGLTDVWARRSAAPPPRAFGSSDDG